MRELIENFSDFFTLVKSVINRCRVNAQFPCPLLKILRFTAIKNHSSDSSRRVRQNLFYSKASVQFFIDSFSYDVKFVGPSCEALRFSSVGNSSSSIFVSVVCLFFASGPIAILRAIWAIVISAFKSQAFGWISHVGVKVCGRFSPTLTHFNVSSAIVRIISRARVVASIHHIFPRFVNPRSAQMVGCWHG